MDMYQYRADVVSVQNTVWGHGSISQQAFTLLQDRGISNAVTLGRQGRGVVMVRAGGDGRGFMLNANDDGYASDPR